MFRSIILLFLVPNLVLSKIENGPSPIVCLRSSANVCFEGTWLVTSKNNQYASFQGIRYAQPPVGELRLVIIFSYLKYTRFIFLKAADIAIQKEAFLTA